MNPYNLKMKTFILIGILLSSVMVATAIEITGGSTNTNTVTGGNTVTNSGTGGQGGGGGGGLSGENYTNIEVNEKYYLYIYKDKVTSYRFTSSGNPVMYVNITGNTSPGEIRASVEVLRDTSTLVNETAPGIVYRNSNIWVGTSGYAVAKNIKAAVIRFRVENTWISANGFSLKDIKMFKWDGTKWNKLETVSDGKDSGHSYFEANTDSFSSFAIVGLKGNDTATSSKYASDVTEKAGDAKAAETSRAEKSPGFEIALIITAIYAVCMSDLRKK